jgi:ABC-type transport system substrate-binding protein
MKKLLFCLLPFIFFISCGKELETITVKSDAKELLGAPSDSVFYIPESVSDEFVQVRFGEVATVESLDPLFASSNSEYRVINLLYEGLVNLNSFGSPSPGLAKRWDVNTDSTRFTFYLRNNVRFHDSPAFESGNGRRFTASDVSYVFKRMANNDIPDFTADHFEDIVGFTAYHNEQTYVKNPINRVLTSIEGIQVRNDSTIVFHLNQSAPDFLQRLTHPMASIYAKETVPADNTPIQKASGTDRFRFIKKEGNAHLLTPNRGYRGFTPNVSRLDIVSGLSEKELYQEFGKGNLDVLIETTESTLLTVADSSGNLMESMYPKYNLEKMQALSHYDFYYNMGSGQGNQVNELIDLLQTNKFVDVPALGSVSLYEVDSTSTRRSNQRQFIITQTKHPLEQFLLNKMAVTATSSNFTVSMNTSYALSNLVTFSTRPFPETQKFLTWKTPIYVLTHDRVSGIKIENEAWNLNLISLKVSGGSQ